MTTAWKPETLLPFDQVLCVAASGSSCIPKTEWLECPCTCTFMVSFYCWSLTPFSMRNKYCKYSAVTSPRQIHFSWGCSPSLFSVFKACLFPHKLTCLKQECIKKTQPFSTSSPLRSMATSSPFSAYTLGIWTVKGEAPAKLGRSGEEGWLGFCCPAGVFAGCGANCRAKQTLRLHFKLLPERCC